MKHFWLVLLVALAVQGQDTVLVGGYVTLRVGGQGLAGVVCSTEVCEGTVYKGKDTTDYRGSYQLRYSRGSNVRYIFKYIGYVFTPNGGGGSNLQGVVLRDAIADTAKHTLRGYVRYGSGEGVEGVLVTISGTKDTTVTTWPDPMKGFYRCSAFMHYWGTYTVTPSKSGCRFEPVSRTYTKVLANDTAAHFLCIDETGIWVAGPLHIGPPVLADRYFGLTGRVSTVIRGVYITDKKINLVP